MCQGKTKGRQNEISERISQDDNRTQTPQNGRMEEATIRLREGGRTSQTTDGRIQPSASGQEIESSKAERYAKENDIWISLSDVFKLGAQGPSGNENDTYFSPEGYVYKVNNLMNSGNIVSLFERLSIHNQTFPETAYELYGFTGFEGRSVFPVIRQRAVCNPDNATTEDIEEYMKLLGFQKVKEYSYCNGEILISDLRPRNVLKDIDGDIYIVDAEFKAINY